MAHCAAHISVDARILGDLDEGLNDVGPVLWERFLIFKSPSIRLKLLGKTLC